MSREAKPTSELEAKRAALFAGPLKHARTAALVASLVPLAQVAVAPTVAAAQQLCPSDGCPVEVPEPATLLLLAPAAVLALRGRRK